MNKKRREIIASNEISELKEYTLNGYAQKVLVEGKRRTNPINIFAVSWGSILTAKVAEAIPELLHRVVIYGQVLKQLSFNEEVFAGLFLKKKTRFLLWSLHKESTGERRCEL